MLIKFGSRRKPKFTEQEIELAKKSIEAWDKLSQMIAMPGWELFKENIDRLLSVNDKVSNLVAGEVLYRQGYVNGLNEPLTYLMKIETAAQTAREILDASTED